MAAKAGDNGIIYGVAKVSWNGHEIGWISKEGIQPKTEAPQFTPVFAAQVQSGPVAQIMSSPGSVGFGFKLIQLKPEKLKELFGGKVDSSGTGKYTIPKSISQEKGLFSVDTLTGHKIELKNTRLVGVLADGLNTNGTLSYDCTVTGEVDDSGEEGNLEITPPQDA